MKFNPFPASPSLITSQFQSLVVSLFAETCFHVVYIQHAALKGLKEAKAMSGNTVMKEKTREF